MAIHHSIGGAVLHCMVHTGVSAIHSDDGVVYDISVRMPQVLQLLDEYDNQRIPCIHMVSLVLAVGTDDIGDNRRNALVFGKEIVLYIRTG